MSLPSLAIRRPVTTLMFFAGVLLLGVIAFQNLAVDFLPSVRIPKLTVQTSYANVSPEEIENSVTQPIEGALTTVTGAKKVSSVSREGLSVVTVEFYWGTNMDFAMLEVREKLDQLRAVLPREAGRPTILQIDPAAEPIMTIALSERGAKVPMASRSIQSPRGARSPSGEERDTRYTATEEGGIPPQAPSLVELKETARALVKRRIEQVNGVAQVSVLGGLEREIVVEIDTRKLAALDLTLDQLSHSLASANLNLPGGTIKRGLFRYSLRTLGEFTRVEEIRNVVVGQTSTGRTITVADLGSVRDTFKERIGITRYNGREIIAMHVRKEAGANTVEVSRRVHGVLQQLRNEYPDLQLDVIADHAEFISKSIVDVRSAIVIGAILAFLVLFLFLRGIRYPVIIGLAMPISILATFVAMYFLHINLNVISLTGLALGIGMLGDNAIIVVENVTRLREKGLGLVEAAIQGGQEITLAVTASTLTNVAIFLPIVFVQGVAQQLFVDMGATMAISLLVSLLVAATLVPMLVSRRATVGVPRLDLRQYLSRQRTVERKGLSKVWSRLTFPIRVVAITPVVLGLRLYSLLAWSSERFVPGFYAFLNAISGRAYDEFEKFLDWALRHRLQVIGGSLALFVGAVGVSYRIPSEAAPDIDQSRFNVSVEMPKGTTLQATSDFISKLEQAFLSFPGIKAVYSAIGITEEQYLSAATDVSVEKANLEITVRDEARTAPAIDEVRAYLQKIQSSLTGVEFSVKRRGTTFERILRPEPNDIKVRVIGPEQGLAFKIAERFSEQLQRIKGIVDLRASMQRGSPEYQIEVDREQAGRYGLSVQAIAEHLAQHVRGREATYLSDFDRKITIRVKPTGGKAESMDELLSSTIAVGDLRVPARELVHWKRTEGYSEIWRENSQRAVLLVANVSGRSVGSAVREIEAAASSFPLPSGYTISIGGENEEIQESFRSLLIIIVLSLFLVYMILAAEYESILYPFVILLTSPLAFIGAILAMALTGQNYNVMSLIGIVIMIGAVDNDAVIAVDVITALRREGMSLLDAIKQGMRRRMRPILMTTATTVLGIIPLVFEFGTGSELVRALTAPLVGGLIASTFFTVVAIPVVYSYVDRWAMGRKGKP